MFALQYVEPQAFAFSLRGDVGDVDAALGQVGQLRMLICIDAAGIEPAYGRRRQGALGQRQRGQLGIGRQRVEARMQGGRSRDRAAARNRRR